MLKNSIRDALTPDALAMLGAVHRTGSMAAAAREMQIVPSAITYRVRQLEDALDVLLFDRSSRRAALTPAGHELLREGERLLVELDAIANRVKRVATGWEPQLTLAIDTIISRSTVMELCGAFFALGSPTRLKLREEALSGTLQALTSGQADLAVGVVMESSNDSLLSSKPLGNIEFIYVVAPHHPLASATTPITDAMMLAHRVVAVADSVQRGSGVSIGLLGGQDVFTVPSMTAKLDAQLRGLGAGFLPAYLARPYLESGRLVQKKVVQKARRVMPSYAWRTASSGSGRALQWWLKQLDKPKTRQALLER